ncbi:DUF4843 domain-containing protein [Sinomicrobium soli]|uniref:DUF4843 domain-containing protein n=1 Tax=Sinomicrobium sp. N-1-3-6 TaxID=2219864 RepID=UPI000DCF064F|nr:DUF4843 domain-containing protein [Sinomicrobium sp. N-1-3-6]RAV29645.1 hypothetical protein DN748_05860 [Sinomicrobium sp. N-1-3-6]
MKKLSIILLYCLCITTFSGCFKDYEERYLFTENRVEFEDAVVNDNSSGKTFPILGPVASGEGTVRYRVNMTGEQADVDRTVNFRIVVEETTAREGIDYRLPQERVITIPANDSFGWLELEILPDGGGNPVVVFELVETGDIGVMDRYHQIGVRISFPFTAPDPGEVEELDGIRYFKNITFGANSNQNVGYYIDLETGNAYTASGADDNQEKIDFIVLRSGAGSGINLLTPSSGSVTAWGSSSRIPEEWDVRNNGSIARIQNATGSEQDLFDQATSRAELWALYDELLLGITDRVGYSGTNHGPASRVREVSAGDLLLYRLQEAHRNVFAIVKVEEVVDASTGHIRGEMKSGEAPVIRQLGLTGVGASTADYIDFSRGIILTEGEAELEPENIDVVHMRGSNSKHNLISVTHDGGLSAFSSALQTRVEGWPVRNNTTMVNLGQDQVYADLYESLNEDDRQVMEDAFDMASQQGAPEGRLTQIATGDIIMLNNEDRGIIVAINVIAADDSAGMIIRYKMSEE